MTRREAREQAFIIIFEKSFNDSDTADLIAAARDCMDWEVDAFVDETAKRVFDRLEEIDGTISSHLKSGWSLARLPKVTLSLLRLAVCEMKYNDEIPDSVAINEAVELCKKYATAEDAAYLNGVLGAVARESGAPETAGETESELSESTEASESSEASGSTEASGSPETALSSEEAEKNV